MGLLLAFLTATPVAVSDAAPHALCLAHGSGMAWLQGSADAVLALAFLLIPLIAIRLLRARGGARQRPVASMAIAFIVVCAVMHGLAVLTAFVPGDALLALAAVKLLAAGLSVASVVTLQRLVPSILAMPSRSEMVALNGELQDRIAEQDRCTAIMQENQTRLMLAQEAGRVGSWDLDVYVDRVHWSAAQYALYGVQPGIEPMTWQMWQELLDPADRVVFVTRMFDAVTCDADYEAEFQLRLPDGTVRWVAERGRVVASDSDGSVRMVGVSVDITESKRLAESNQRLANRAMEDAYAREVAVEQMRVMFEHLPDALFVMRVEDPAVEPEAAEFVFEAFNPATERLTGQPVSTYVGLRPEQTHPAEQAAEMLAAFRSCMANGPVVVPQPRLVRGQERLFETALAPVRDPRSGRVERIIGAARDVTERSELERRLRHVARAEATNRLTAGIAHDFNNLLQALMGGLEMLLLETETPMARSYAEVALHAAQRGAELTHRLLAFSRQQTLQPQPVDAAKLLGYVASLLEHTLPSHVTLLASPGPDPEQAAAAIVLADPGQLEAAMVNLVANAAEAMPGGGRIEIGVAAGVPPVELGLSPGHYAVVTVSDNGPGMNEAMLQQCCEPFFTTKGPRGSGLGLSMVQGFARQSGGELCIRTAPGEGCQVSIWLPAPAPEPVCTVETAPAAHILLVDDAPDVLVIAGAFLHHGGFEVTRVDSGQAALDYLQQGGCCDALVTDFAMPGLSGFELLTRARVLRPNLPGLIITGFDRVAMGEQLQHGRVLQKPFGRLTLVAEVQSMLEEAAAAAAPASPQTPARPRVLETADAQAD